MIEASYIIRRDNISVTVDTATTDIPFKKATGQKDGLPSRQRNEVNLSTLSTFLYWGPKSSHRSPLCTLHRSSLPHITSGKTLGLYHICMRYGTCFLRLLASSGTCRESILADFKVLSKHSPMPLDMALTNTSYARCLSIISTRLWCLCHPRTSIDTRTMSVKSLSTTHSHHQGCMNRSRTIMDLKLAPSVNTSLAEALAAAILLDCAGVGLSSSISLCDSD